jgi:hypothetical protein
MTCPRPAAGGIPMPGSSGARAAWPCCSCGCTSRRPTPGISTWPPRRSGRT